MKVLPLTYLLRQKFEHSLIKIQLKARIREEISALIVSVKINRNISNLQKQVKFTIYRSSKTVKHEIQEREYL